MKFRFRLRTLLILTAVVGVAMYWFAKPVFEQQVEASNLAALERLVDRQPVVSGWKVDLVFDAYVPAEQRNSFRKGFFNEGVFERVTRLRLDGIELTPEIVSRIRQFKYLKELSLNRTNLNDTQCRQLAALPHLRVLDCVGAPVGYETLVDCRRRHSRLCHLAHRRALVELRARGCSVSKDYGSSDPRDICVALTGAEPITDDIVDALKHVGRPVSSIHVRCSDLSDPVLDTMLDELAKERTDFKYSLSYHPKSTHALTRSEFDRIGWDRVGALYCSNISLDKEYEFDSSAQFRFLSVRSATPQFLRAFVRSNVQHLEMGFMELQSYDASNIPASIRVLRLNHCTPAKVDLFHCVNLEEISLNGKWSAAQLLSFLDLPFLKKVTFYYPPGFKVDVGEAYKNRGVVFRSFARP